MKVLALDQATNKTGWSILDDNKLITYGIIDTSKEKSLDKKIAIQKKEIKKIISKYKPELFGLEDIFYLKNMISYKTLAELLGVLSNCFYEKDYCFIMVKPSQWKSYCHIKGRKREEQKKNSIKFVKDKFSLDVTEDEADSICIGWYISNIKTK